MQHSRTQLNMLLALLVTGLLAFIAIDTVFAYTVLNEVDVNTIYGTGKGRFQDTTNPNNPPTDNYWIVTSMANTGTSHYHVNSSGRWWGECAQTTPGCLPTGWRDKGTSYKEIYNGYAPQPAYILESAQGLLIGKHCIFPKNRGKED